MTTSTIYLNVAASMLATMLPAEVHPLLRVACLVWLGWAVLQAHRAGLLEEH